MLLQKFPLVSGGYELLNTSKILNSEPSGDNCLITLNYFGKPRKILVAQSYTEVLTSLEDNSKFQPTLVVLTVVSRDGLQINRKQLINLNYVFRGIPTGSGTLLICDGFIMGLEGETTILVEEDFSEVTGSQQSMSTPTKVTYAALVSLIGAGSLVPGAKYEITDYTTKHNFQENGEFLEDINEGPIEPLIVTAHSASELSPIARSASFPNHIIHYDVFNNLCEDGETSRNGYIYYRKNEKNNVSASCDFKAVKLIRYSLNAAAWVSGTDYNKGYLVKVGSTIYKKLHVDTPHVEPNTTSPDEAQMWIEYLPAGKPLLDLPLSSDNSVGFEAPVVLTGVTQTRHEIYIFQDSGVEASDQYSNIQDCYNTGILSNNSYQDKRITGVTLSPGCTDNTFMGDITRTDLRGSCRRNIFRGFTRNFFGAGAVAANIFGSMQNVTMSSLCQCNVILQMVSSNSFSEFVFNDIKYAGNCQFGSDIWGNIIRKMSYCQLNYHFARNFVYEVAQLSTLQKVEFCYFGLCEELVVEHLLLYTIVPTGTKFMTFACPNVFGNFDLETNVSTLVTGTFYKKLILDQNGTPRLVYWDGNGEMAVTTL